MNTDSCSPLHKAFLAVLAAKHTDMFSFEAVHLRVEHLEPRIFAPYRVSMHHVPIERPLTMPSGPKAALDYLSMLQLTAKRGFDFHEYSY